jgi:FAD/FMN-containing dehydrogenase
MTKTLVLDEPEPDGTVALVTVQAGMKVWQLCDLLDDLGYTIPVLGNVTGQSAGGVISTGTHGKNPRCGSLFSLIQNMRLVLANGNP